MRGEQRHVRVLLDEQDGRPLGVDLLDHPKDRLHQLRSQTERRLVEQQDRRLRHQRARDGQHLLLAARQRAGVLLDALFQHRKKREDPLILGVGDPILPQIRAQLEVVGHRQVGEDAAPFRHMRHAQGRDHVRLDACDVPPVVSDCAAPRLQQTGNRAQSSRLPRAIRPDECDDLSFLHEEIDSMQRGNGAVSDHQIANAEHWSRIHADALSAGSPR